MLNLGWIKLIVALIAIWRAWQNHCPLLDTTSSDTTSSTTTTHNAIYHLMHSEFCFSDQSFGWVECHPVVACVSADTMQKTDSSVWLLFMQRLKWWWRRPWDQIWHLGVGLWRRGGKTAVIIQCRDFHTLILSASFHHPSSECQTRRHCAQEQVNTLSVSDTKPSRGSPAPVGDHRHFDSMMNETEYHLQLIRSCFSSTSAIVYMLTLAADLNLNWSVTGIVWRRAAVSVCVYTTMLRITSLKTNKQTKNFSLITPFILNEALFSWWFLVFKG